MITISSKKHKNVQLGGTKWHSWGAYRRGALVHDACLLLLQHGLLLLLLLLLALHHHALLLHILLHRRAHRACLALALLVVLEQFARRHTPVHHVASALNYRTDIRSRTYS